MAAQEAHNLRDQFNSGDRNQMRCSSVVEQVAVNHLVLGSNPNFAAKINEPFDFR